MACGQKIDPPVVELIETPVPPQPSRTGPFAKILELSDTVFLSELIAQKLEYSATQQEISIQKISISNYLEVAQCYALNQNKALWVTGNLADSAINALNNSVLDGFLPEHYNAPFIESMVEKIKAQTEKDLSVLAELDILITSALLRYGADLLYGRVDPKSLNDFYNFEKRQVEKPLYDYLFISSKEADLQSYFGQLRPQNPIYKKTCATLAHYRVLAESGGWKPINWGNIKKLEPGDTNPVVPELRERLVAEGILDTANLAHDSVYDLALQAAFARFQQLHGLRPDSVIGKSTMALLNMSVEKKVTTIICNLERLRWGLGNLQDTYLLVNGAEFRLYYFMKDTLRWSSEVIIGKQSTKTPFFRTELTAIVFNPTWTVPYSIATKEILPKLKKNPGYLATQNMVLLSHGGEKIDPTSVDFSVYNTRNFPYIIRQEPGSNNSLGHVKFNMPNPYSIYLHDTPSRTLFNKEERAFSHGCIRLNKPLELAEMLLKKQGPWHMDTINSIIKTRELINVKLEVPIPVLLTYITHYTDANGNAYFFADVYKRDDELLKALQQ